MQTLAELRAAVSDFGFTDYLRHLKAAEAQASDAAPLRVAILRSYTAEPLEPILRFRLLIDGYNPSSWFGGFNQYAQEILDDNGALTRFHPDVILLLVRLEELVPEFLERYAERPATEWSELLAAKARELAALAERAASRHSARVFVQNAVLATPYFGSVDGQQRDSQQRSVDAFNRALAEASETRAGIFIWDFERFTREQGLTELYDPKSWYVSRNPFKQSAYPRLVDHLWRQVRATLTPRKKCIVLDLDNTLWGGVAGEDGLDGVQIGQTYPGNCFRDFQRGLLALRDRGILLAVNSKNNEADAVAIIEQHPEMILRRQHFAALRINWDDKAGNLRSLAQELNIGLDAMIFIDDNAVECELIRRECPDVEVVRLPDKPYLVPGVLDTLASVDTLRLTAEDRRKAELYQARARQREEETQYANLDDFLRTLQMEVVIEPATSFSIPRIAQLTQKTNQLNMTTRRYSDTEIAAFSANSQYRVFSVAARDRFGDHGIVGVLILEFAGETCRIDTFLLSCRVIGRRIEALMLSVAAEAARGQQCRRLVGEFFSTPKNAPAAGFYESAGMTPVSSTEWVAPLTADAFAPPSHIRVVGSRERAEA
jgi:FkbH-like protein